jgi:hypothetical protein
MCDATQNVQETGNKVLVSGKRYAAKDLREECQRAQELRILSIRSAMGQHPNDREEQYNLLDYFSALSRAVRRINRLWPKISHQLDKQQCFTEKLPK